MNSSELSETLGHIFRTCGYCQKILIFERYEMDWTKFLWPTCIGYLMFIVFGTSFPGVGSLRRVKSKQCHR